jgi:hypothetical protein
MMIEDAGVSDDLPRNIHDDEKFHPGCSQVPPSLPETEITPVTLMIVKARMSNNFGRVLRAVRGSSRPPYEKILEMDRDLRASYQAIPEIYKIQEITQEDTETIPTLLIYRFILASIHNKSLIVLHSRYLKAGRQDQRYDYSRRSCLNSSLTLLQYQAIRNGNAFHSGQESPLAAFQTSITSHDYLLANAVISCELVFLTKHRVPTHIQGCQPSRDQLLQALEASAAIWKSRRATSAEAYKASDVLHMLLKRLQLPEGAARTTPPNKECPVDVSGETSLSINSNSETVYGSEDPLMDLMNVSISASSNDQQASSHSDEFQGGFPYNGTGEDWCDYWMPGNDVLNDQLLAAGQQQVRV